MNVIGFEQSKEDSKKVAANLMAEIGASLAREDFTPVAIELTWDEFAILGPTLMTLSQAHVVDGAKTQPIYNAGWDIEVPDMPTPKGYRVGGYLYGVPLFVANRPKRS